jgi:hypothetical protein
MDDYEIEMHTHAHVTLKTLSASARLFTVIAACRYALYR